MPISLSPGPLTNLAVRGFKSIREQQAIELRPLTILAGANSSGKSSMMQPLLLLKQTLAAPFDPGALLLDGDNVHLTSAEQALHRLPGKQCAGEFAVRLQMESGAALELVFTRVKGIGFDLAVMTYDYGSEHYVITPSLADEEIRRILPRDVLFLQESSAKSQARALEWAVTRERCFFRFNLLDTNTKAPRLEFDRNSPSWPFVPIIEDTIHLPGLRGNPERTYPRTAVGDKYPGTFERYVASVVAHWEKEEPDKLAELGSSLAELGLTWKVKAAPISDTQLELRVGRLLHSKRGGAQDLVNIADVGFGVSQTLPVLVAVLAAYPGQIVYIEQPEIHLHPKAQRGMARVLADAARRGVIVIAETHSSLLLRAVQTMVAEGELAKELVRLHWFERNPKQGVTTVRSADLDEMGAYGEEWPQDFDDTSLQSEKAYLDAVEKRGAGE